jgi:hypothetical protein
MTEASARRLTREHLLGYCPLPEKCAFLEFLRECEKHGIADYEDPDLLD